MSALYIGLISGTSADGIDAALLDLSATEPSLIATHFQPYDSTTRGRVAALCTPGDNEIELLGQLDIDLGGQFAAAALQLLRDAGISPAEVRAIGSHGQTVRHRPAARSQSTGFTLQITDPNTIAELTGITTVADFRRRDMAAGGQGAPFAPAFHCAIAPASPTTSAFLNLGGIANITLIDRSELVCGFDTGPANGLMDAWILHNRGEVFDRDGAWAGTGRVNQALLDALKAHEYFGQPAPKSTGREVFHLEWLQGHLQALAETPAAEDVQATLLQLSCETIAEALAGLSTQPGIVYLCGGGAHNSLFRAQLQQALQATGSVARLADSGELGISADWIEASAFAWLAQQRISGCAVDLRAVTGAAKACVLGAVYAGSQQRGEA